MGKYDNLPQDNVVGRTDTTATQEYPNGTPAVGRRDTLAMLTPTAKLANLGGLGLGLYCTDDKPKRAKSNPDVLHQSEIGYRIHVDRATGEWSVTQHEQGGDDE